MTTTTERQIELELFRLRNKEGSNGVIIIGKKLSERLITIHETGN